jgi:hypothetical protein
MGALRRPIRGIEILAITAVTGAAAATAVAFRSESVGCGVAGAVAEADGDVVLEAIAMMLLELASGGAEERPNPVAGMLASRMRKPAAVRRNGARLMDLCSQPAWESQ